MKRALLPVIVAASLSLTACAKAPPTQVAETPVPTPPAVSDVLTPERPAGQNSPDQPAEPDPTQTTPATDAPAHLPPAGGNATNPTGHVEPKPAIKWYPKGIGLPLTSDDPAAQGKKVVMLTFDDGPSDTGSTASILDTLARENVKATFFITGYGAKHRDLVERIHREGHELGPHTVTHANLSELSPKGIHEELDPVVQVIKEVTGENPKWLRPPFGAYNQTVIDIAKNDYGMGILNWTDGSLDWDGVKNGYKDPNIVIKDTMEQLYPGAVVLMHDTLKHTAEALPEIIKQMKSQGYEFVVLN
ncbi:MAG TPA: polysaccharide deacetylase family protein [Symbiobacteriaceae bacterium]|nr:polysaccharide deacetylase family protein [Symbiobacteriaceae bacterium]